MGSPDNLDKAELSNFIKETNNKLEKFASILEKFGLDIITKMGQTNLKINMLTDKVDEVSKATIDVKALLPQLTNVIENQKILEAELDLIRTLIQRSDISFHSKEAKSDVVERDTTATDKKQAIVEQFNLLVAFIEQSDDPSPIMESLENIKEDIFVYTGGHRILYEIGQFINRLNSLDSLSANIKEELREKITFWINKLSVKG
jgi:K+/H+ antiporter YhaU regulatory subunit KhtT